MKLNTLQQRRLVLAMHQLYADGEVCFRHLNHKEVTLREPPNRRGAHAGVWHSWPLGPQMFQAVKFRVVLLALSSGNRDVMSDLDVRPGTPYSFCRDHSHADTISSLPQLTPPLWSFVQSRSIVKSDCQWPERQRPALHGASLRGGDQHGLEKICARRSTVQDDLIWSKNDLTVRADEMMQLLHRTNAIGLDETRHEALSQVSFFVVLRRLAEKIARNEQGKVSGRFSKYCKVKLADCNDNSFGEFSGSVGGRELCAGSTDLEATKY
eukprot:gene34142-42098_t